MKALVQVELKKTPTCRSRLTSYGQMDGRTYGSITICPGHKNKPSLKFYFVSFKVAQKVLWQLVSHFAGGGRPSVHYFRYGWVFCLFVCFGFYVTSTQYRSYRNVPALLVEDLRCPSVHYIRHERVPE
jgi:hypothetical protein